MSTMRWAFSLLLSCLFTSAAVADNVGVFTSTSGEVQILRGENYLAAAPGVEVAGDDIVETAVNASAQLDMEDGSVLKLGPETRLVLSDYRLDSNNNVVSAAVEVLSGWLRFAVAKIKPEGRYDIHTPVLTIGVRGTEGTIEAQNERGGLHLNEGVVDVTPVGKDLATFQPVRVSGGEYIQRVRGESLAKLPQPPSAFQNRLPPIMQQKLARRAQELKQRGVPPRVIRAITREDARRFIERHPHLNDRLRQRFRPHGAGARVGADPRFGDKLQHPPGAPPPGVSSSRPPSLRDKPPIQQTPSGSGRPALRTEPADRQQGEDEPDKRKRPQPRPFTQQHHAPSQNR